jgi:SAM-dependent methyltransferase
MKIMRLEARHLFKRISWRDPFISFVFNVLDPFDQVVREWRELNHLPKYSTRVRSNGVTDQFGGQRFVSEGQYLKKLLQRFANLAPDSNVLEIGCGCGRVPVALIDTFRNGSYLGVDIDEISLQACQQNTLFDDKPFYFSLINVYNEIYNPSAEESAEFYHFPFSQEQFDVIFLFSVFTHMLPASVANYIKEISRMLNFGGRCLFSCFLMDYGHEGRSISFPYRFDDHCLHLDSLPEKAVGYYLETLDKEFARNGMKRVGQPLIGNWRLPSTSVQSTIQFAQDILVYSK